MENKKNTKIDAARRRKTATVRSGTSTLSSSCSINLYKSFRNCYTNQNDSTNVPSNSPEHQAYSRNSHPEVFLEKSVLKICSKFTGEHPCRSLISIKLLKNIFSLEHLCTVASELAVQLTYDSSVPCVIEMTAIRTQS